MFGVVESWWRSKDQEGLYELRRQLSRDGVMNGENHKEGVQDTGHGCGKPLAMAPSGLSKGIGGAMGGGMAGAMMGELSSALGSGGEQGGFASESESGLGKFAEEAIGGGALGGLVGALAGGVGGSLLSGFSPEETQTYSNQGYTPQGSYQQEYTEVAHQGNQYAQARYTETALPGGGTETDYQRYEQRESGYGSGFEQRTETRPMFGGGYEEINERVYERAGGEVERETWREGRTADGRYFEEPPHQQYGRYGQQEERFVESGPGDRGFGGAGVSGIIGGVVGAFGGGEYGGGNEAGWGEREREEAREEEREEREEEREEEYREEYREEEREEEYREEEREEEYREEEYREESQEGSGWFN